MSTTGPPEIYKVVGVGEPPKTGGSSSVPTCSCAAVVIVSFPGTDVGNNRRDVGSVVSDVRELLTLNGVGSDALIAVTTGEMIERAGVDAGIVSLEVSTTGPELSLE